MKDLHCQSVEVGCRASISSSSRTNRLTRLVLKFTRVAAMDHVLYRTRLFVLGVHICVPNAFLLCFPPFSLTCEFCPHLILLLALFGPPAQFLHFYVPHFPSTSTSTTTVQLLLLLLLKGFQKCNVWLCVRQKDWKMVLTRVLAFFGVGC